MPLGFSLGVMLRPQEVQGDVGLVPQHPTVVSRWDVEHVAGLHFYFGAVVHRDHGTTRYHHADMLDLAALFADRRTDVLGPLPARRITGPSHGHTTRREELELPLREDAAAVRGIETLDFYLHERDLLPEIYRTEAHSASGSAIG